MAKQMASEKISARAARPQRYTNLIFNEMYKYILKKIYTDLLNSFVSCFNQTGQVLKSISNKFEQTFITSTPKLNRKQ